MTKVTGVITAISQKEDKYGIAIGKGNWYNGFGQAPCNKGDKVEIDYEQNGTFKNVKGCKVLESGESEPSQANKYNMQMSKLKNKTNARISAQESAVSLITNFEKKIETSADALKLVQTMQEELLRFIEDEDISD